MKVGTKLVCINDYCIELVKLGDVVTFDGIRSNPYGDGRDFIFLKEHNRNGFILPGRVAFDESYFRPLLGQSATAELVSSFIEITETSDLPIRSPQPTEPCGS